MQFSTWLFNSLVLKSFHAHALADSQFQMWWIWFSTFLLNNSAQSNQIHIVRLVDLYRSFSIQSHFDVRLYPLGITHLLNLFFFNVFARKKKRKKIILSSYVEILYLFHYLLQLPSFSLWCRDISRHFWFSFVSCNVAIILHFCLNLCCSISRIRRPPSNGNSAKTGFTKSSNSPFAIDMYTIPRARSRTGTQSELLLPFSFRFQFQFLVIIAPHTQGNIELSCNRKRTYTRKHLHQTTRNKRTSSQ